MPRLRRVAIERGDDIEPIGEVDVGVQMITDAEAQLQRILDSGLFTVEEHREFDMHERHESVEALRSYERTSGNEPLPADLAERARAGMRPGDQLLLTERIRATRLAKARPPSGS